MGYKVEEQESEQVSKSIKFKSSSKKQDMKERKRGSRKRQKTAQL